MTESAALPAEVRDVLTFWFDEMDEEQWYLTEPSAEIDGTIRARFMGPL